MLATNKNSYYYILETLLPFGVQCELYRFKHYKIFSLKITKKTQNILLNSVSQHDY